jgi:hypothetical protein
MKYIIIILLAIFPGFLSIAVNEPIVSFLIMISTTLIGANIATEYGFDRKESKLWLIIQIISVYLVLAYYTWWI